MKPNGIMITISIFILITWTSCFNISSVVDKDELWRLLLNRQISQEDSNAFHLAPLPSLSHDNSNVVNAVKHDKVNEFSYDVDGGFNDDEVKADYVGSDESDENQNKILDNSLQSVFMDIFNVSVADRNETADVIGHYNNVSVADKNGLSSNDSLSVGSKEIYDNATTKFKREEYQMVTPSVISIDVFKPSDADLDDEDVETVMKEQQPYQRPKPGQTSLVIVFDGTGSMENCLIQLRAGAKQIIDKFAKRDDNPIYNYIFVPFRDPRKILTSFIYSLCMIL